MNTHRALYYLLFLAVGFFATGYAVAACSSKRPAYTNAYLGGPRLVDMPIVFLPPAR